METNYVQPTYVEVEPPKKKSPIIIVLVVVAVILLLVLLGGGLVAAAFMSGAFLSPNQKVVQAAGNTVAYNELMKALDNSAIIKDGIFTTDIEMDVEGVTLQTTIALDRPDAKASIKGEVDAMGLGTDFEGSLADGEILLNVDLLERTFRYSYTEKKDGFLADYTAEQGLELDQVDKALKAFFSESEPKTMEDIKQSEVVRVLMKVELVKAEAKNFKVDGESVKCQGYEYEFDSDFLLDLVDAIEDDYYSAIDEMDDLQFSGGLSKKQLKENMKEEFNDLRDEVKGVDGVIRFYVYKKQLAAIYVEADGEELLVEFHGGSTPWANTEVSLDDKTVLELNTEMSGDTEEVTLFVEGEKVLEYEYNPKNGEFLFVIEDFKMEGVIENKEEAQTITIESIKTDGERVDAEFKVTVEKGASVEVIDDDDAFDLGNASEGEYEELYSDIQQIFMRLVMSGKLG